MVQLRVLSITAHHLLSFRITVPDGRVTCKRWDASGGAAKGTAVAQDLDGLVECGVLARHRFCRQRDRNVGDDPLLVDPALVGREPASDRQLEGTRVRQLDPLLDRALAERRLADDRRPFAVLEGASDDLAGRCAAAIDEDDELNACVGRDAAR